tara:strand:+ start:222 stop:2393 length:2172 start_codon:yes stop_codon:yes gene_type:complete
MQKVQIYVGSERLELFKDETVSITQSIQNIKDISKIFTEFTQSFTIPASPTNSKIFTHYYNYNIVGGFDARRKVSSSIELNYLPWKNGFMALNGVDLKNNKPYAYRITFFGETINLKDIIGEDMLSSISTLSVDNLDYDPSTVKTKLQIDPTTTDIIAPLITHTKRLYYNNSSSSAGDGNLYYSNSLQTQGVEWSDLKYAIRVHKIIESIESHYTIANGFSSNIVFSDDFFSSSNENYYNLFMWLHRKKGSVQPTTQVTEYISLVTNPQGFSLTSGTPNTSMNSGGNTLSVFVSNYLELITNYLYLTTSTSEEFQVVIIRNGLPFFTSPLIQGTGSQVTTVFGVSDFGGTLQPGGYTVSISQTNQINITFSQIKWELNGVDSGGVNWTDIYTATSFSTDTNTIEFNITEQIPEMKVIDFLTGLFKMFNLTAYVEDGIIVVKTLDEYYQLESTWNTTNTFWQNDDTLWNEAGTSGASIYSLDEFMDVNSSQVNVALPFKQVNFEYEGLGTFLAEQYNQLNNIGWGTERYTLDSETYDAPNEVYKVQLPFEHVQYERLVNANGGANTTAQYGYFVDQNQQAYFGKPLLFYPILQTTSGGLHKSISFRDTSSLNSELTSYIIPSNSVALSSGTDTSNINFSLEINEYQLDVTFTGTLFATYYENYIAEIFNTKRRMFKVTAYLPLNLIYNLKLYDTIEINYENYRINSMTTDLTNGKSSIELINLV